MKKFTIFLLLLTFCSQKIKLDQTTPIDTQEARFKYMGSFLGTMEYSADLKQKQYTTSLFDKSLNILKNHPLLLADKKSGIIITDWHTFKNGKIKIQVFTEKDPIEVIVFKQSSKNGKIENDEETSNNIKKRILA